MKGLIISLDSEYVDDKCYVNYYGRLENGESFKLIFDFQPYFYIKKADLKVAETIKFEDFTVDFDKSNLITFSKDKTVKVLVNNPRDIANVRKTYERNNIACFEADIRPQYRLLYDYDVKTVINITGNYIQSKAVNRVYDNPIISKSEPATVVPKLMSFDIETDMDVSRIYSIGIVCGEYKHVLIVSNDEHKGATSYIDEKSMLEDFLKIIKERDPDIITGWNVIDFDFNVIQRRLKDFGVDFICGRENKKAKVYIYDDFFQDSKLYISGRVVIDGIDMLKSNWIDLPDYKLKTAAKEILGESKLLDLGEISSDELYMTDKQRLIDYNLKDAQLVIDIVREKKVIELCLHRSYLTTMPVDRINSSIASLDSMYLPISKKAGYVCPSSYAGSREERVKGAYVKEGESGIYENIVVFDFKSLYPSVIRTFNIDPISFVQGSDIVAPNKASFKNDDGILPQILASLGNERDNAKKNKDDVTSWAIKITMNSIYGVLANPNCRFFSLDMANAITSFAREILHKTEKFVEDKNYNVIYGDTDSVFIDLGIKDIEKTKSVSTELEKEINIVFSKWVKDDYHRDSVLEIEFEKFFTKFMLPHVRGSTGGAKKRYVGMTEKGEIKFTGMEFVRSDWTEIAREFQLNLIKRVFEGKDFESYIKDTVNGIKDGKFNDKLVYRKSIRKDLESYTKTTPPHVKAARKLDKITSSVIAYVITTDGPEPIEKLEHSIDHEHYIEKQLKPLAESVLVFFDKTFEDVMSSSTQKGLFDF